MTTPGVPLQEAKSQPDQRSINAEDISTLAVAVATALAPSFSQVIKDAETRIKAALDDKHGESTALIQDVKTLTAAGIEANAGSIQDILGNLGGVLTTTIKTNPRIQFILIVGFVGVVWIGSLATWIAYLAGSPDAKGIIGWAGAAFAASTTVAGILHQLGFLGATNTPPQVVPVPVVPAPALTLVVPDSHT